MKFPFITSITEANRLLAAVAAQCIFARNGMCWASCPATDYCDPKARRLKLVADMGQGNIKGAA